MFSRSVTRFCFTLLATSFVATAPAFAKDDTGPSKAAQSKSTYEMLNLFGEVFDKVRSDYVEPVTDEKLIESALNGMLTALDPHSSYMDAKNFEDMRIQTRGQFGGLGIEVTMENGLVKVVTPIDDTPAARAGLKSGDFVGEIDNTPVMGLSLSEAVDKMRGKVGSKVKLTILREGEKEPFTVALTRETIKIQSVKSRREGDVIYLRVTSFMEETNEALLAAYKKERAAMKEAPKGVILDLRNNGGGLLDQAVAVSDDFLEQGEIVSTRARNPQDSQRFTATKGDITGGLPMVVLINEGSASASEIVAGALKDHQRAVTLGVKSFGKGSVQTVIPIPDHGAIRLTTARYYTPSGTSIQAKGIVPDIVVEQAKLERLDKKGQGRIFSEASLRGHLNNDQDAASEKQAPKLPMLSNPKKDGKQTDRSGETGQDKEAAETDYQLSRAVDLLRGIAIYHQSLLGHASKTIAETSSPTRR